VVVGGLGFASGRFRPLPPKHSSQNATALLVSRQRNLIERMVARLKDFSRIATRPEISWQGVVLAAAIRVDLIESGPYSKPPVGLR
jgi:transposase